MTPIDLTPLPWMDRAACAQPGVDPELFHPGEGNTSHDRATLALAICAECPVKAPCGAYGEQLRATGIWGGTVRDDARTARKRAQQAARPPLTPEQRAEQTSRQRARRAAARQDTAA